ncbi:hypothetical protein MNBD_CHLOROFLEXI01-2953 [hydrothermal vent metagenome]|uniref:Uncharacterized protein n=1 Tax=hydrothermal vent metagenome TaxID=652676 RepID=A0A3B0UM40_9ZZZZ
MCRETRLKPPLQINIWGLPHEIPKSQFALTQAEITKASQTFVIYGTKKCSRGETLEQEEEENELQEIQPYGLYIIKLS